MGSYKDFEYLCERIPLIVHVHFRYGQLSRSVVVI